MEEVLEEAKQLAQKGIKELVLVAQEVTFSKFLHRVYVTHRIII
jgi:tRNA A37 methylthiotransferase MiaB